ncbi:hypothetical protein Afil01_67570 [Actinorhabdospora filicis]|uniref:Uncharacterized protein n=1 Tax=Actinorhabdospora filicis TaxID=1785913 RepID=A0A9W6WEJ9_9ACTN|nr:hypothetical protein Afil01_67570 [Actinorhabdospora filicis]
MIDQRTGKQRCNNVPPIPLLPLLCADGRSDAIVPGRPTDSRAALICPALIGHRRPFRQRRHRRGQRVEIRLREQIQVEQPRQEP